VNPQAAITHFISIFSDPTLTWDNLAFLREHTRLPILLKGILHPDDALKAIEYKMDGIIVSNHGGRQLDGARAALDALADIAPAVQKRIPVLFDSGIRGGADAFKALARGAHAVLLGRPYLWGLALGGEQGVREVMLNLLAELDLTLALSGYSSLQARHDKRTFENLCREPPLVAPRLLTCYTTVLGNPLSPVQRQGVLAIPGRWRRVP
jgi:isopentenyl diphosphate isomerase/L-lactate dehydrogenase-like FMN-dependent dehydrogenase